MSEVSTSIDLAVPPERVWEVLMDPDRLSEWVTIHRNLGEVSDRPLRKGSKLEQRLCVRGVTLPVKWEVTELDGCRMARWDGRGPARSRARTEYRLSPNGNGATRFDYVMEFKAPLGPLGAAASRVVVGGVPEREAKASLDRLKKLLEG